MYLASSVGPPIWKGKFVVKPLLCLVIICFLIHMYFSKSDRLMKAQTLGDTSNLEFMRGRRIFEINPDHPIIKDLSVRPLPLGNQLSNLRTINVLELYEVTNLNDKLLLAGCLQK